MDCPPRQSSKSNLIDAAVRFAALTGGTVTVMTGDKPALRRRIAASVPEAFIVEDLESGFVFAGRSACAYKPKTAGRTLFKKNRQKGGPGKWIKGGQVKQPGQFAKLRK